MDFRADTVTELDCPHCGCELDPKFAAPLTQVDCPHCGEQVEIPARLDHYHLLRQLGAGSSGYVFKAFDTQLHRQVALKVLLSDAAHAGLAQQCLNEARTLAALNHPSIVQIYGLGQCKGQHYLVMELVTGGSLQDFTTRDNPLSEMEVLRIARSVVAGLRAAYDAGLVHMDVKPGNILLDKDFQPKIIDFGAAQFSQQVGERGPIGTPRYIAPEIVQRQTPTAQSDMFSLGATLFHLLAGRPPFEGRTKRETMEVRQFRSAPSIRTYCDYVHRDFDQLIARLLAIEPSDRFETYDELAEAMDGVIDALEGILNPPEAPPPAASAPPPVAPLAAPPAQAVGPLFPPAPVAVSTAGEDSLPAVGASDPLVVSTAPRPVRRREAPREPEPKSSGPNPIVAAVVMVVIVGVGWLVAQQMYPPEAESGPTVAAQDSPRQPASRKPKANPAGTPKRSFKPLKSASSSPVSAVKPSEPIDLATPESAQPVGSEAKSIEPVTTEAKPPAESPDPPPKQPAENKATPQPARRPFAKLDRFVSLPPLPTDEHDGGASLGPVFNDQNQSISAGLLDAENRLPDGGGFELRGKSPSWTVVTTGQDPREVATISWADESLHFQWVADSATTDHRPLSRCRLQLNVGDEETILTLRRPRPVRLRFDDEDSVAELPIPLDTGSSVNMRVEVGTLAPPFTKALSYAPANRRLAPGGFVDVLLGNAGFQGRVGVRVMLREEDHRWQVKIQPMILENGRLRPWQQMPLAARRQLRAIDLDDPQALKRIAERVEKTNVENKKRIAELQQRVTDRASAKDKTLLNLEVKRLKQLVQQNEQFAGLVAAMGKLHNKGRIEYRILRVSEDGQEVEVARTSGFADPAAAKKTAPPAAAR